jgi:hypothetical protein
MSNVVRKIVRVAMLLVFLGLVAWGIFAARQYQMARRAAAAITDYLYRDWPEGDSPRAGTREVLLSAAERMEGGDWDTAAAELASVESITPEQRAAANKFFVEQNLLRRPYVAAVNAARVAEREGADVEVVRVALKRALLAASRGDHSSVEAQVGAAHAALEALSYGEAAPATAPTEDTVAGLLAQVGPSFLAGRELLLEGHGAVENLLRRARRHYEDGDYGKTAALTRLAAELSGVDASAVAAADVPAWFQSLPPATPAGADRRSAESAVGLCESMAASSEPSKPVSRLIRNAKRELAAERFDEALWWARVALNALGLPGETTPREDGKDAPPSDIPGDGTA